MLGIAEELMPILSSFGTVRYYLVTDRCVPDEKFRLFRPFNNASLVRYLPLTTHP
jgi:hypothetical protein